MLNKDLVIIGGGSAGMAAALHAKKCGVNSIIILEKNPYLGGILNQCIHNGFGIHEFGEELTGPEYMSRFIDLINKEQIEYKLSSCVLNINEDKVVSYTNANDGYCQIKAKCIIMASGCYERNAGSILLPGSRPSGIFTAGQAQMYLNCMGYLVGKKIFILGSGDIGLIMARRMSIEGAKVLGVAEINPYSAGLNRNIVQCLNDFNIPLYLSYTTKEIKGKDKLEQVTIAKVDENMQFVAGSELTFDVDTLLLSIGLIPNISILDNLNLEYAGRYLKVNQDNETSLNGLFVAGNALHVHDLVDYVSEEARFASQGAVKYLNGQLRHLGKQINVCSGNGITYVIPNIINIGDANDIIKIKFRVTKPYKDVKIYIKDDEKVIKSIFKSAIVPSEMEIVDIEKNVLNENSSSIKVFVEEN